MNRRKIILGAAAFVLVGATTSTFWLSNTGIISFASAPVPSGMSNTGNLSSFDALNPSAVSLSPGAQKASGVLLGKVTVAAGYASKLAVDASWLDPQDAGKVLKNPNAWISFELDYPVHMGACSGDVSAAFSITDTSVSPSVVLCVLPNTSAVGSPTSYSGSLTITSTMLTGYLAMPGNAGDPAGAPTCNSTGTTWCAPTGLSLSNQNVFYVTASIYTPGTNAPGQQSSLTGLQFYLGARTL
ncbi:MAG TPA: hypothetical protein VMV52_07695 [Candidatus Nanopelagicaceae bacterium]|nr:hypothetical protein [Candidatus Nanopelagicaceae bacterium]